MDYLIYNTTNDRQTIDIFKTYIYINDIYDAFNTSIILSDYDKTLNSMENVFGQIISKWFITKKLVGIDKHKYYYRYKVINMLNNTCQWMKGRLNMSVLMFVLTLEKYCYNHIVRTTEKKTEQIILKKYSTKCGIFNNYLSEKFSYLNLNFDDIKALILMTEREICPSIGSSELKMIHIKEAQRIELKTSALYVCPKCKYRKCLYRETQTRALDEAATIQCICTVCNTTFIGK